jgi:hypothetical protein
MSQMAETGAQGNAQARTPTQAAVSRTVHPQMLLRLASVTQEVLEEVRRIRPQPAVEDHLRRLHARILAELEQALTPDLYQELRDLVPEIKAGSLEELALAHAEILGWLQGLFQGTQLAIQLETARAFEQHLREQLPVQGEPAAGKVEPKPPDSQYL